MPPLPSGRRCEKFFRKDTALVRLFVCTKYIAMLALMRACRHVDTLYRLDKLKYVRHLAFERFHFVVADCKPGELGKCAYIDRVLHPHTIAAITPSQKVCLTHVHLCVIISRSWKEHQMSASGTRKAREDRSQGTIATSSQNIPLPALPGRHVFELFRGDHIRVLDAAVDERFAHVAPCDAARATTVELHGNLWVQQIAALYVGMHPNLSDTGQIRRAMLLKGAGLSMLHADDLLKRAETSERVGLLTEGTPNFIFVEYRGEILVLFAFRRAAGWRIELLDLNAMTAWGGGGFALFKTLPG